MGGYKPVASGRNVGQAVMFADQVIVAWTEIAYQSGPLFAPIDTLIPGKR